MSVSLPDQMVGIAKWYAKRGFSVFPAWPVDGDRCACGNSQCKSPGKHPIASLVPHGVTDAVADEAFVSEWWAGFPDANIGIATGDISGIVVVDVDVPGLATMDNLQRVHGELPPTWAVETGSGGFHFYYRCPNVEIRNSVSGIGPGIDVRGNGGYVIAPPSNHVSGRRYQWGTNWHPRNVEMGHVPDWLLKRMVPAGTAQRSNPLPDILTEGTRNNWLANAAGSMRRKGFSQGAIAAALKFENRARCKPPLDDREVDKIAWSIARYEPGSRTVANA